MVSSNPFVATLDEVKAMEKVDNERKSVRRSLSIEEPVKLQAKPKSPDLFWDWAANSFYAY